MRGPCSSKDFCKAVDWLRQVCPPPYRTKVEVHRLPAASIKDAWPADTAKARSAFKIVVGDDLTDIETDDALVHEWAHMMCWTPYHPLSQDHDEVWGVWYARIYRAYMRVN